MCKTGAHALTKAGTKPSPVPLRQAFLFRLTLGFISFGGPDGQIAIMHQELVENRRWISEQRFLHALNFCMVLPLSLTTIRHCRLMPGSAGSVWEK